MSKPTNVEPPNADPAAAPRGAEAPGAEPARKETSFFEDLRALFDCPRELWLMYAVTIFEYVGLYSFMSTLSLWLTSDFGFDDKRASGWFAIFAALLSLIAFLIGSVADVVGLRRVLVFSFGFAMLTRTIMSTASGATAALIALVLYAFALSSASPVIQAGVHRYSNKRTTAIAFSFFYLALNIGGVLAGQLIDRTKALFIVAGTSKIAPRTFVLPLLGPTTMTAYRAIIGLGTLTAFLAFACTLAVRSDEKIAATRRDAAELDPTPPPATTRKNPLAVLFEVVSQSAFWRFMLLMGFLVLVKAVFVHMHSTWPKYITRERGEAYPWGTLWALNSWLILAFTPVATALTRRLPAFKVIVVGSFVTALSPFIFALGPSGPVQVAAIVVLTLGEALWSPRSYEYTVSIAPKGRESTYVGMSSLPYFMAKSVVGVLSGQLLSAYCPATGPRNSSLMWTIIGFTVLAGPLGILLLRKVIERGAEAPAATVAPLVETGVTE